MGRYIVRRVLLMILLIVLMSMLTFLLFYAIPRDPARATCGKNCTPAQIAANRHALGYDKPIYVQYADFAKGLVETRAFPDDPEIIKKAPQTVRYCSAPCLGYSFYDQKTVNQILIDALPVTLSEAIPSFILFLVFGIGFGILAALRRGKITDRVITVLALILYSVPVFFTGLVLKNFFQIKWQILPPASYNPITVNPFLWAQGLVMPWIVLASLYAALYVRVTRANMVETMGEDFVRTARAKGLPRNKVIRQALRAAVTPVVTLAGIDFAGLLGGAAITETIFNLEGLGRIAVRAVTTELNLPVLVGIVLFAATIVIVVNFIVDLLYGVIDPRVRYA